MKRLDSQLRALKYINLNSNVIGSKGCVLLGKMKWVGLQHLEIAGCCVGNEGLVHLAKSTMDNLQKIDLNRNYIGVRGLYHFAQLSKFKKLKYLHLNSNLLAYSDMYLLLISNWRQLNFTTALNSLLQDYFLQGKGHFLDIERVLKLKFHS